MRIDLGSEGLGEMTIISVNDCINELNNKNCYNSQIKDSPFISLLEKTRRIRRKNPFQKIFNFLVGIVTVIQYEKLFYETQSENAQKTSCEIIPELKGKFSPKRLITRDFVTIDMWDINPNNSKEYVIFCEGISSEKSCETLQKAYLKIIEKGYGVAAFDYRGRGASSGYFSQKGALNDIKSVYSYLINKGIKPQNIGIIAHSMGTGVACDFSEKTKTAFTVLINPFSKAADMAKNIANKIKMPEIIKKTIKKFPSKLIPLKNRFDNEKALENIMSPVLLLHNTGDETIPVEYARKLYKKNNKKNNLYYMELDDCDHEINKEKIDICLNFIENLKSF